MLSVSVLLKTSRGLKRLLRGKRFPSLARVSVLLKTSRGLKLRCDSAAADIGSVSVLLKTSRGLKHVDGSDSTRHQYGFSALEDEPWIEALIDSLPYINPIMFQCS